MNRLHPATMVVAFLPKLYDAFRTVLPFLAISFFSGKSDNTEVFIAAIGVLGGFGAIATYLTTRYGVEDGQMVCTSGWLFKRDRRIPLEQIQNINIKQGMLERMLKVVTMEVETAAGSGSELKLQVVTEAAAEQFRSQLALSGPVRTAEQVLDEVIYRMDGKDLILGAMTENNGGQVIFALIGSVGATALIKAVSRFAQVRDYVPTWIFWVSGFVAVGILFLLGWLYGGIQYSIKNAFFTVRREPEILRITHGLITKLQYAVRLRRVEIATVSTTIWQRMIKCAKVQVGTAGSFGEQGAMLSIAMMLPNASIGATLERVLPGFRPDQLHWIPFPKYFFLSSFVRTTLTFCLIGGAAMIPLSFAGDGVPPEAMWAVPLLLGLLIVWSWIELAMTYRRSAYAFSDDHLVVRGGFFRQTMTIMPIAKIDTVGSTEPPWWRVRGVTNLVANGMVHSLTVAMLPMADASRISELILRRHGDKMAA